jgi:hypothetical protein
MQLGVTLLLSVELLCSVVEYGLVTQGAQANSKLALDLKLDLWIIYLTILS